MPQFIKQRDYYSCGPVAVANTIKALGGRINYSKTRRVLQVSCKATRGEGTDDGNFSKTLKKFLPIYISGCIKIHIRSFPTLSQIEQHLRLGGIVVVNRRYPEGLGHYSVISGLDRDLFTFLNDTKGKTTTRIRRRTFRGRDFQGRGKGKDYLSRGWFIRRNP